MPNQNLQKQVEYIFSETDESDTELDTLNYNRLWNRGLMPTRDMISFSIQKATQMNQKGYY